MKRRYKATDEQIQKAKEKLQDTKEKSKNVINEIISNYRTAPDVLIDYLQFSSRFYKYSMKNTALIFKQNPYATFVQSFAAWKKMNCMINKGSKGMTILVPKPVYVFHRGDEWIKLTEATSKEKELIHNGSIEIKKVMYYGLGTVFDIGQTNFPVEDYPKLFSVGFKSDEHHQLFQSLKIYCEEYVMYSVKCENIESISLKGYCNHLSKVIVINDRFNDTEKLKTLSHEIGHAIIHDNDNDKTSAQKEVEADVFSLLCQSYYGFEIPDSQKEHLVQHFKCLEKELEAKKKDVSNELENILEDIYSHYKNHVVKIEEIYQESMQNDFLETNDEQKDLDNIQLTKRQ